MVSKLSTWDERDRAIVKGLETFNNETAPKIAADRQARFGSKGKDKYWYGYKEHTSVDMQSGLINKVAATPANVDDAKGLRHVCPDQGAFMLIRPIAQRLRRRRSTVKDATALLSKKTT